MTLGSELDWGFVAESNPHLNGRAIPYAMDKVLGGWFQHQCFDLVSWTSCRLGFLRVRVGGTIVGL
jgi:hypothetical protein